MVTEIVSASKANLSVADYLRDSILRPIAVGANHDDRVRVVAFLVESGCLLIRDDRFVLIQSSIPDWLIQAGAKGFKLAFELRSPFLPNFSSVEKFDQAVLNEIGLKGELAFVEYLRNKYKSNNDIRHVSLFDDTLGYDVLRTSADKSTFMYEVKTTSKPDLETFEFYLSRNEYRTSKSVSNWKIACMRISEGEAYFEGFLHWENLRNSFPIDQEENISWSASKVTVRKANLLTDFD
jgi:hypothetical protein